MTPGRDVAKRCETTRLSRFAPPKRLSRIFTGDTRTQRPFYQAEDTTDLTYHHRLAILAGSIPGEAKAPDGSG
jgi:hypothetical protein